MVELETKTAYEVGCDLDELEKRWVSLDSHNAALKELESVIERLTKTTFTNFAQGKKEGYEQAEKELGAVMLQENAANEKQFFERKARDAKIKEILENEIFTDAEKISEIHKVLLR